VAGTDLTLVTDRRRLEGRSLPLAAAAAARAGVEWIQVREKDLPAGALLGLVREIAAALVGTNTRLLVNGRVDVAAAAVRRAFPGLVVSASRHSIEGARRAEDEGADLLLVGPVFPTPGKTDVLGLKAFEQIAREVSTPVHAIGGIEPSTARCVVDAGASGVAAIRAFLASPSEAVRAFREALG
jgi:thiamine monophosphate synthase